MRMPPRGHVRIQWALTGQRGSAKVTIPAPVARMVGPDRLFRVELVDEGILLRAVDEGAPVRDALPAWLLDGTASPENGGTSTEEDER